MDSPTAPTTPRPRPDGPALQAFVDEKWDREIVPALTDYITIPAKSPAFDADWVAHGYIDQVVRNAVGWLQSQPVRNLTVEILRLPGRTPVIYFEAPATRKDAGDAVLMYGHLDKQPEFSGWRSGLGPWTPKYLDGKLYGRGGADDGYAVYASLTAVLALDRQGIPRPRCIGLIETCEESGSYDLLPYVEALRERMGQVALVVCLDSGAGNYDQLWMTTSLRGLVTGTLEVQVLDEGVHSGDASGVVPSTFRILRQVLDRLEDSRTGRVLPECFHCEIPSERVAQAQAAARILGDEVWKRFPWSCGSDGGFVLPVTTDPAQATLNRTWRPALSVTGAEGLPPLASAGNVLRPRTAFKLSLRLPPLVDAAAAAQELKTLLERDAPYRAKVDFKADAGMANGWNAPPTADWLGSALEQASQQHFGAACGFMGEGGTIPLMNLLLTGFPKSQFMICGVLGPKSNAHGPNEFLHVPYAKRLTACVAQVIAALP
ncbi:Acetylornithine deacetylase/succinyl-diaminopimelate desuccinylase-like protein OS=Castellaniella defragrans OX=75697 GN=HNR28_001197 PE=4 SV=1 [Castellaniella defragrans]